MATTQTAQAVEAFPPSATDARRPTSTREEYSRLLSRMRLGGLSWDNLSPLLEELREERFLDEQDAWHTRLSSLGRKYEGWARTLAELGERPTERQLVLRAAACHHFAQRPFFDNPEAKFMTRRHVSRLFRSASALLPPRA